MASERESVNGLGGLSLKTPALPDFHGSRFCFSFAELLYHNGFGGGGSQIFTLCGKKAPLKYWEWTDIEPRGHLENTWVASSATSSCAPKRQPANNVLQAGSWVRSMLLSEQQSRARSASRQSAGSAPRSEACLKVHAMHCAKEFK